MGWDLNRDGELRACVYDALNYENNACSDFMAFASSSSTPTVDRDAADSSEGQSSSFKSVVGYNNNIDRLTLPVRKKVKFLLSSTGDCFVLPPPSNVMIA